MGDYTKEELEQNRKKQALKNGELPAFPSDAEAYGPTFGITIRDWFAGLAMQGELSCQHPDVGEWMNDNLDQLAKRSYKIADAMLIERNK